MTTFVSFTDWNLSNASCNYVEVYGIGTERWSLLVMAVAGVFRNSNLKHLLKSVA